MQTQPERLGAHTLTPIADERNQLLLSAASSCELAMKFRQGRVRVPSPPDQYVPGRMLAGGVDGLPVLHTHALFVPHLDDHHQDSFDRLLVSQAMLEDLPIMSANPSIAAYDVELIDATR